MTDSLADRLEGWAGELVNNLAPISIEQRAKLACDLAEAGVALRAQPIPPAMVLGWAWAEACARLDAGEDPRTVEMPEVLDRMHEDMPETKTPLPPPSTGEQTPIGGENDE